MIFVLVYFRALPGQGCQLYAKAGAHYWAPGKDDGAFRFSRKAQGLIYTITPLTEPHRLSFTFIKLSTGPSVIHRNHHKKIKQGLFVLDESRCIVSILVNLKLYTCCTREEKTFNLRRGPNYTCSHLNAQKYSMGDRASPCLTPRRKYTGLVRKSLTRTCIYAPL